MAIGQAERLAPVLAPPPRVAALARVGPAVLVISVAFVTRLGVVLTSNGGFSGRTGYDSGVYYAASAALLHGRLPYRDYTLIHPPGITLLLSPFAVLGGVTTDHLGFVFAMLGAMSVGATSALLIYLIGRTAGLGRPASVVGGLFYAVSYPAVSSEFTPRLEPFGNLFVLLGVLAFVASRRRPAPVLSVLCGAALAIATSFKIWYVVPLAVVVLWSVVQRRGRRRTVLTVAGAVGALAVVDGPFFVLAPGQMFRSVILDQLGRPRMPVTTRVRLESVVGLRALDLHGTPLHLALGLVAILVALLVAHACRTSLGRLGVALFAAQTVTLLLAPSFFSFYADYAATGAALTVAAAAASTWRHRRSARLHPTGLGATTALLGVGLTTVVALSFRPGTGPEPLAVQRIRQAVAGAACVQSDEPSTLIALDVLSRDLNHGCPLWVDVTGRTYGIDSARGPDGNPLPRPLNPVWQHALRHYLRAGNAVILTRPATGLDARTRRLVTGGRVLGSAGGYVVHALPGRPSSLS